MNYQHSYHAGGIADVFKHIVLIQLLKTFLQKSSAFSYIETHAGDACYDLSAESSQKTLEYEAGIEKLLLAKNIRNEPILEFIKLIDSLQIDARHSRGNPSGKNRRWIPAGMTKDAEITMHLYPGSSLFARQFIRAQDEEILCELHPEVYKNLYHYYRNDKQVHVHHRNGYEALAALIPPKTKRGLVLIDPPFEITDEYQQILKTLDTAYQRWPTGIYSIWFPIKKYEITLEFYQALKAMPFNSILCAEFWSDPGATDNRLKGSGLVILNPPWKFDHLISDLLPHLAESLNLAEQGNDKVSWLKQNIP